MAPLVLHCHMPKTAGSALNRQVLRPRYAPARVVLAYGPKFERRRRLPLGEIMSPHGIGLIAGHVPFGYADDLGRHVLHVSMLRDPVERMFSFLNFVAVAPRHGLRKRFDLDMQALAREDPARFVTLMLADERVRLRQTNVMTRLASGMARLSKNKPDAARLGDAVRRVREAECEVGVQERFDQFAARLRARLDGEGLGGDIAALDIDQSDEAEKRLPRVVTQANAPPAIIEAVRAANGFDQRLYDFVADRCVSGG